MEHTWRQWEPQIIYVHHQSSPFPTRIWLPPFAEPIAHARAVPDVAGGEHDRHGDRAGARGARAGRRHAHGHRLRRVVSRVHRLHARCSRTSRRSGPRPQGRRRRRASTRSDTFPPNMRSAAAGALREPVAAAARGRCAMRSTTWRRRRCRVLDYAARYKDNVLLNRYRSGKRQIAQGIASEAPVRVLHSAGPARPGRRGRDAAAAGVRRRARVAADRAGDRSKARRFRPARG